MSESGDLAGFFHALSDESRLRILQLVNSMELTVGEVAQVLGQSQPRISRHLRIMDEADLIRRRREGSWTFVEAIGDERGERLGKLIGTFGDREIFTADRRRLDAVRSERASAASEWFDSRAERWGRLRQLHASEESIETVVADVFGDEKRGMLVDIGTGTGRMIELFAGRVGEAVGIDRSPDMLRLARVRLDEADIGNASLRQGDMTAIPLPDGCADAVILHLVLHYAHSPSSALSEAARLLRPGGQLLLVDFEAHGEDELRRLHGHQRLGFRDERIGEWCDRAGLSIEQTRSVAGDPLTVKIWKAVRPESSLKEKAA